MEYPPGPGRSWRLRDWGVTVSRAEQAATTGGGFEKHAVAAAVRRAIRDAMLDNVNVDPGPQFFAS